MPHLRANVTRADGSWRDEEDGGAQAGERGGQRAQIAQLPLARGAGVADPGSAYCSIGSSAWVCQALDHPLLDAQARIRNVQGVFALRHSFPARHVLLVDDTFTTGATLAACYNAVRSALGPSVQISIATLAVVQA